MASDILIVDDEADIREMVAGILQDDGHRTRLARDSDEALKAIEERRPQLVILDIWLQGSRLDGLEVLNIIKKAHPDLPVVIISGHGNIETAVTAIKRGAYDYIEKPFKADRLVLVVLRALEASKLQRENRELRERSVVSFEMIGKSTAMNQLRGSIERVAPTNSRVLIRGGAGSGKELCARVLHGSSLRKDGPFVVLNAAAMAPDRVEEEFFGTEDHAGPRKVGALEEAHGGTLYIDEVADMPLETQGKVLRVLVEQKFQRVGGGPKVSVDVRIISSTSRDLEREMQEGRFREDLYHRLNVVPLRVPGLAERRDDIPELISYFVVQVAQSSGLAPRRIGEDAIAVLQAHDWPGNVRELRNNLERLMILSGGDPDAIITANMLPDEIGSNVPLPVNGGAEHLMSLPLREAREIFEREYLLAQIDHPVAQAAYGLDLLESYRLSGNRAFLDRAIAQANRLVNRRAVNGAGWFYPYPFDFALHGRSADLVRAPWYSGMAQGLALSLFVRLHQLTGTASWGTAADATFASFQVGPTSGRPWVSRVDASNHLWIEEYPRWPAATSDRTINGFEFALMGLYEYAALRHSTAATLMWDGGLTTLLAAVAEAANDAWASRYCLAHDVVSESYHLLVVNLLGFLEHESGSSKLGRLADRLVDAYPPQVSGSLRITLQPGVVTAVKYSSTGAVLARRTLRLARRSEARADLRHRVRGGPIAYRMTNGYFAGYEIAEVPKVSYALGRYVRTDYLPARTATVRAGSRLTGAQLSAVGGTLRSKSVTFPTRATALFDMSDFVNGRRWTHLTSGPLAGYWVPTTSILLD